MHEYRATLDRIIDADSVWLRVDLGFRVSQVLEFRLSHIDAPKLNEAAGIAARKFVEDWFTTYEGHCIINTTKGSRGVDKQEKWGRWLATIRDPTLTSPDTLNDELVRQGMAVPYEGGKKVVGGHTEPTQPIPLPVLADTPDSTPLAAPIDPEALIGVPETSA